ncbi:phospholipase A and acyltransferase 4 [Lates calcarifer]|uniref:Phospholipase A and acyltransferase 4 n=1 Tax=Lates calcarifer TaxID=8187 RepID=A0AAJ7LMT3_LATCA|nr:phospholipase A and acyltransferase 4 [Lates calcarifer]
MAKTTVSRSHQHLNHSKLKHSHIPLTRLEPEPGDLIEIFCVGYQHWAVYVGDRDTVHLVNPPEPFFYIFQVWICRGQKKEKLIDVVGNNKWQINNILDTEYKSRPAQRIVKNALLFVAKDVNYTMSSWNCEHFASEQRYGKATSSQV